MVRLLAVQAARLVQAMQAWVVMAAEAGPAETRQVRSVTARSRRTGPRQRTSRTRAVEAAVAVPGRVEAAVAAVESPGAAAAPGPRSRPRA